MAIRTINSPGVEIGERDLSLRVPTRAGTNVYITGFSQQGPYDEVLDVSSYTEFEDIYGTPKTPAERYFSHTVKAAFDSTARIKVNRLPYGGGSGQGFGSLYSILAYPVKVYGTNGAALTGGGTTNLSAFDAASYVLGAPTQYTATEDQYLALRNGTIFSGGKWSSSAKTSFAGLSDLGSAGLIVINSGQTTIDNKFYGFYLGLKDNTDLNPATDYTSIRGIQTAQKKPDADGITPPEYINIPTSRFAFGLTATNASGNNPSLNTVSQVMEEKIAAVDVSTNLYKDTLNLGIFKLRQSIFSNDVTQLDYALDEGYNGSIGYYRKTTTLQGGTPVNFFLENVENTSRNIEVLVNPYISDFFTGIQVSSDGIPKKTARVYSQKLIDSVVSTNSTYTSILSANTNIFIIPSVPTTFDTLTSNIQNTYNLNVPSKFRFNIATKIPAASATAGRTTFPTVSSSLFSLVSSTNVRTISGFSNTDYGYWGINFTNLQTLTADTVIKTADSLFPLGAYSEVELEDKKVGNIPAKLSRALETIRNDEVYDIDVIAEGGLGTIWATVCATDLPYFDDTLTNSKFDALRTSNSELEDTEVRDYYTTIANQFAKFCGPLKDGGRGDILYVADPLRQILVTGKQSKVIDDPTKNFSQHIYWALRHQYELVNTSYATVYANYMKVYDESSGLYIYAPPSGFIAAKIASTDSDVGPWGAPAGFNRGILNNAVDLAIAPNQRQRDELYKVNLNPITRFPDQGLVVFGQKTMLKAPSAFDRVNVRRTFLYLEKIVKSVMKFFLFENNTVFTRTRVVNTLTPFFQRVKAADGLYDFLIVCDERNNTPEVIDNNELVVDIYLKPVRTAEFILVNFYATRTDTNFQELVGG
jgi:hypothetical protein